MILTFQILECVKGKVVYRCSPVSLETEFPATSPKYGSFGGHNTTLQPLPRSFSHTQIVAQSRWLKRKSSSAGRLLMNTNTQMLHQEAGGLPISGNEAWGPTWSRILGCLSSWGPLASCCQHIFSDINESCTSFGGPRPVQPQTRDGVRTAQRLRTRMQSRALLIPILTYLMF